MLISGFIKEIEADLLFHRILLIVSSRNIQPI